MYAPIQLDSKTTPSGRTRLTWLWDTLAGFEDYIGTKIGRPVFITDYTDVLILKLLLLVSILSLDVCNFAQDNSGKCTNYIKILENKCELGI